MDYTLLFVHGWSVTNVDTYGYLPDRLRNDAIEKGMYLNIENIFLGEYISFHDEVRVEDLARAFHNAVIDIKVKFPNQRFVCITHSTGGPIIRTWWQTYYKYSDLECPISHLIMLAPPNFGSPLAQLGKKTISRFLSEIKQVEPGIGVLEWLEQGSAESINLNLNWIFSTQSTTEGFEIFPFVITGDYIDRNVISHLISFTHEMGSDGVVRAASANLNCAYIRVIQRSEPNDGLLNVQTSAIISDLRLSPRTPFLIVPKRSHSGENMGIMNSVQLLNDEQNQPTIDAILDCLAVNSISEYLKLANSFEIQTDINQKSEITEELFWFDISNKTAKDYYIHDRWSMLIFRLTDTYGHAITEFDMRFTSGPEGSASNLPNGFLGREQKNHNNPGVITYYLNYDILIGSNVIESEDKTKLIREKILGIGSLGFNIFPYPSSGFIYYSPIIVEPSTSLLKSLIRKNSATIIDVVFHRQVAKETFELNTINSYDREKRTGKIVRSFKDKAPNKGGIE